MTSSFPSYMTTLQMMARKLGTESNEADELVAAFKVFDKNGDGCISKMELKQVMAQLGENLTDEQLNDMMKEADVNGDGGIDFEEFKKMMGSK